MALDRSHRLQGRFVFLEKDLHKGKVLLLLRSKIFWMISRAYVDMIKKILVIDDEVDVITYLTTVLESNGYETHSIDNVKSAMDEVKRIRPDLICLDIVIPQETGVSFYARLRQNGNYNDIPVIIISGMIQSGEFDFRSYISDKTVPPPEGFMEKPVDIEELINTIEKLISDKSS